MAICYDIFISVGRGNDALFTKKKKKKKKTYLYENQSICLQGEDMREGNSPSWFNPMEALQVMRYLKSLNPGSSTGLTFDDIGIITPYRKQVSLMKFDHCDAHCCVLCLPIFEFSWEKKMQFTRMLTNKKSLFSWNMIIMM